MSANNKFTIYWKDGSRKVITGVTMEDAFTTAGYGAGAVAAIDWYDNGISQTHHYNMETKEWVKYESVHIASNSSLFYNTELNVSDLIGILRKHRKIIVDFPNEDILFIQHKFEEFSEGWAEVIYIAHGEYNNDSDEEDDGYYNVSGTQYFDPDRIVTAVTRLIERVRSETPANQNIAGSALEDNMSVLIAKQNL